MSIRIGNAPCSWGVEFADDPRNPSWEKVLADCAAANYAGIELGPIGFMPEDPAQLGEALARFDLSLIGGVVFQPFHDPEAWGALQDAARRTCVSLAAHGAKHLVLIDSISPRRAPTAGRVDQAEKMDEAEWRAFVGRISAIARMGTEEYGLTVGIHAHCAGFMDFEPELERLLEEVEPAVLKICFDTGHHTYAGYDPVTFMRRHIDRISYLHFKDINPWIRDRVVAERIGFYDACGMGIFCNLGQGCVDFPAVADLLEKSNYRGWCTVEQDIDPAGKTDPLVDAHANRIFLHEIGFH